MTLDPGEDIFAGVTHACAGELAGSTVALDTLADIDMLADCDALVLVLRSAVSRLAHHLAIARKGRPVPLISLQYPTSAAAWKKRGPGVRGRGMLKGALRGGGVGGRDKGRAMAKIKYAQRYQRFGDGPPMRKPRVSTGADMMTTLALPLPNKADVEADRW